MDFTGCTLQHAMEKIQQELNIIYDKNHEIDYILGFINFVSKLHPEWNTDAIINGSIEYLKWHEPVISTLRGRLGNINYPAYRRYRIQYAEAHRLFFQDSRFLLCPTISGEKCRFA